MKLSFKINKPSGYVFNCLSNMQQFVALHPVITKMERQSDDSYLVHETLKLGFIPVSFIYTATMISYPLENIVIMRATVMRSTKIEMTFTLKEAEAVTIVEENIIFRSPFPVKSILQNIFKKQHQQLFKNIDDKLK